VPSVAGSFDVTGRSRRVVWAREGTDRPAGSPHKKRYTAASIDD
jgi:hypothetical protein